MHIERHLTDLLLRILADERPQGIILAGVVGCGKTTLVEHLLSKLTDRYEIFSFSGDDLRFRAALAQALTLSFCRPSLRHIN